MLESAGGGGLGNREDLRVDDPPASACSVEYRLSPIIVVNLGIDVAQLAIKVSLSNPP